MASIRRPIFLLPLLAILCGLAPAFADDATPEKPPLWRDPAQALDARVKDLVGRMTLAEKAQQVCNVAPSIPRIGLPAYNYWNECLHGIGRNGIATVFPQAIGMAASFDPALLHTVADAIATEARAKDPARPKSVNCRIGGSNEKKKRQISYRADMQLDDDGQRISSPSVGAGCQR